jgi:acetyl-CoA synthetase
MPMFEEVRNKIVANVDREIEELEFEWPRLDDFNWALDWFDEYSRGNTETALVWHDQTCGRSEVSYASLSDASSRVAGWFIRQGVGPGTRVLVSLESGAELWEIMLAIIKLDAVIVPFCLQGGSESMMEVAAFSGATVIVSTSVVAQEIPLSPHWIGITVGDSVAGWLSYEDARCHKFSRRSSRHNSRLGVPLVLECLPGNSGDDRIRSCKHSRYASMVGRLADLHFTRLIPGGRFANFARAGSTEHRWLSFLGPLTSGAATVALD